MVPQEALMSGDYSRLTFDPTRNFSAVLLQQGRVLTDSDWNEQADQINRRVRAAVIDTFGRLHFASPDAFAISSGPAGLAIGRGRAYVDGLLAENHGAGRLAWDAALDELRGESAMPYLSQPFLPDPPSAPAAAGSYLVYLDVWQREVTGAEDPSLTDPALEVDTSARLQTVWQVRVLGDARASAGKPLEKAAAFQPSGGRLTIQTGAGGYTGLDNRLYRVEIHDGGKAGEATFKWSRRNASAVARVRQNGPAQLLFDGAADRFPAGDWIEIMDDAHELNGLPGEMRRIRGVEGGAMTLTTPLAGPLEAASARIRRWDQKEGAGETGVIRVPDAGQTVALEDGIAVSFASTGGAFRSGDYWITPARPADRSIIPLHEAPPRGIHHHYAELAVFTPPDKIIDRRKGMAVT
jgi:hypothetical protein